MINENALLKSEESLFLCIDLQTRILKAMHYENDVVKNANALLKASDILNIKVIATEQYPKGLMNTDERINIGNNKIFPKMSFSVFGCKEFVDELEKHKTVKNIIVFGIETHVCVYQSVLHALDNGYNVYVVEDSCSSRFKRNHDTGIMAMHDLGAKIISSEMAIFMHISSASHEKFKELSLLIR